MTLVYEPHGDGTLRSYEERSPLMGTLHYGAPIFGVEWNQNTDEWHRIDQYGADIHDNWKFDQVDFDAYWPWGGMWRCLLDPAGTAIYGLNARGDGLPALDGSEGRVMVRIPRFYVKSANPSANVYQWWVSAEMFPGAVVHPAFFQRGGVELDQVYVGAYLADFEYDGADEAYNAAHEKLHSRSGFQPYTGSLDCVWSIPIDDLGAEPALGATIAGTEGGFLLIDYLKTAGAWSGGGAGDTAILWVRKPGDATCGLLNGDAITADAAALGNATAGPTGRTVTLGHCRTLGENIGAGWGEQSIWCYSAWKLLTYIEYADADSQTFIGRGVVDDAAGTGFAGELNGADNTDTNIGTNGTGAGTGVDGHTPVVYRGIENPWGNIWTYVDGYNALDAPGNYRIIKRDGTGTFADTLAAGSYETSTAAPIVADGYISNIVYEDLLALLFIPSAVAGAANTYLHDYFYAHDAGETNILLAGGFWSNGDRAGVACLASGNVAAVAGRDVGARVEFAG